MEQRLSRAARGHHPEGGDLPEIAKTKTKHILIFVARRLLSYFCGVVIHICTAV